MAAGDTEEPRRRQGAARPGGDRPNTGRPPERGPRPPAKLERRDVAWGEHRPQRGPASRETGFRDAGDRPQRGPREGGYQGTRPNNFGTNRPPAGRSDGGARSFEGPSGERRPQGGPDRGPRTYGDRPTRPFGAGRPGSGNDRPARPFDSNAAPRQGRFGDRPDAGRSWGSRPPSGNDGERPGSRRPTTGRPSGPSERFGREKPTAWGEARFAGRERPASSADRLDRISRPSRFGRDDAPRTERSPGGASGAWRAVAKSDDRQWGVTPDRHEPAHGPDQSHAPTFERSDRSDRVQRPDRLDRARPAERSGDDRPRREPTERSERFPARREVRASDNPTYGAPRPQSDQPKQAPVPLADKRRRIDSAPGKPWEAIGWVREENVVADFEDNTLDSTPTFESDDDSVESKRRRLPSAPEAVAKEVNSAVGVKRGARLEKVLMEASRAFERDRYGDSLRMLRPLLEEAPDVAAIRELVGLCLYRQEKWSEALRHLDRFVELTGSVEQHPVLADCHRALRHYSTVASLWEELAASSPSAELVAEGRIVMAGSLGDQGKLADAVALLERGPLSSKRPKLHHLRLWYALADLYERAGDVPRARELFTRVAKHAPEMADIESRIRNL
jgi:thioredoxin-like negative regulator of GroEL